MNKACCVPAAARPGAPPPGDAPPVFSRGASVALDRVQIPGGAVLVGTDEPVFPIDGEGPARRVTVRPFALGRAPVTSAQFAAFVEATGFATEAERFGWSYVFSGFLPRDHGRPVLPEAPWWVRVDGSSWRHPEGPGSTFEDRLDHPVVHVSHGDAAAFAAWAGGRLPTEAEWEHAARGGLAEARFPWGDREPDDEHLPCNIWQGRFPEYDTGADGFAGTSPVGAFAPNGYGLVDMAGNVWEWSADHFRVRSLRREARARDEEARRQGLRVLKGGSHLCHRSYCYRYRIAARTAGAPDSTTGHLGFRVAWDLA
jgi:formylglycine-generating enzyme